MSATADKARFFLEQSVPELKELQSKKVFSAQEIATIAKKRSDFEHKINARGSSPSDYAQYAEFEINVDQLRRKRVKRLAIRMGTAYHGQRRIFFVFDRGMRKFPGDMTLWMQGIEYARQQKSLKKVTQILTNALRMHPTQVELWIYAAQFALDENGDMTEARGYMQRGLRFCKNSKALWLQNFRLEISWIAKIHARRRILGIEAEALKEETVKVVGGDDLSESLAVTDQDVAPEDAKMDVTALAKLDSTPVMTGAIPLAIFDAAMTQFDHDVDLAFKFYLETLPYEHLPPRDAMNDHIETEMQNTDPTSWQACACHIQRAVDTVQHDSLAFPAAIRQVLARITEGLAKTKQRQALVDFCREFLQKFLRDHSELDPAIEKILQSKLRSLSSSSVS